ncbi:membrane protein [Streptomyces sp. NRRL F-4707]|nr:membrane protein [Streptomyces sp. NRRL F-4707]
MLVALCAATGAYCLLRMRSGVEEQRSAAGGEALMGFGMAAMAVPAAVFTPPAWLWSGYVVVFGAAGLRALWAARSGRHHLHHLVGAAAMVYMAVVMAGSPAHAHAHGTSGTPVLTGALLLYFTAYVLVTGVRLIPVVAVAGGGTGAPPVPAGKVGADGRAPAGWGDRPELARACRLSMAMGMLAMLLPL